MAPSTPLVKEHRLRGLPSSTGSPPPPSLAERRGLVNRFVPSQERAFRALAEAVALASAISAAGAAATLSAGTDARAAASRACAAASRAAAATVVRPAVRGTASAFGAAGATSAVLEASSSLALSTSRSASNFVVDKVSLVVDQAAAALRLAWALVVDLGWGGLWLLQAVRLVAYALLLLPGFLRVGLFYFTSRRVARGVRYGPRPRNTADVYVPPGCSFTAAELAAEASAVVARATARALARKTKNNNNNNDKKKKKTNDDADDGDDDLDDLDDEEIPPLFAVSSPASRARPVVVYVTGGAWLIGHRAWGSLLAARLSAAAGAVVVCLDYRNFPQAGAAAAAEDVGAGIGWTVAASGVLSGVKRGGGKARDGGDGVGGGKRGKEGRGRRRRPPRGGAGVVVVGQSAGAHLSALAILSRCAAEEGVVLPCFVAATAAARRGSDGLALPSPSLTSYHSSSSFSSSSSSSASSASASSSRNSSVDVEVDATANDGAPSAAAAAPSPLENGASSGTSKPLRRRPSLTLTLPPLPRLPHLPHLPHLALPSLEDAAETLGAWDTRSRAASPAAPSAPSAPSASIPPSRDAGPPFLDPPEWSPSGAGAFLDARCSSSSRPPPPALASSPCPSPTFESAFGSPSPLSSPALSPHGSGGRGDGSDGDLAAVGGGDIAAFVGVSGVYDVASLAPHLAKRGLRPELLERIMSLPTLASSSAAGKGGGKKEEREEPPSTFSWRPALAELSPTAMLVDCLRRRREDQDAAACLGSPKAKANKKPPQRHQQQQQLAPPLSAWARWPARLPPTALLHGTADACAPASDAARFVEAARAAGARDVSLRLYEGETHTSPLIENPMRGAERDALGAELAALVVAATAGARRSTWGWGWEVERRDENGHGGRKENGANGGVGDLSSSFPSPGPPTSTSATLLLLRKQQQMQMQKRQRQQQQQQSKKQPGAVDGGGALCPGPLISAAALVCPF